MKVYTCIILTHQHLKLKKKSKILKVALMTAADLSATNAYQSQLDHFGSALCVVYKPLSQSVPAPPSKIMYHINYTSFYENYITMKKVL